MAVKLFDVSARPDNPKVCIFGPTGAGKSRILSTLKGRGVVIDIPQIEGGDFVLADKAKTIQGVTCETWEDIDEIYWALSKKDETQIPNVSKVRWIALDTITAMERLAIRKVVNERDRDLGEDPHKITLPEYGQVGQLCTELIFRFAALPYVFILLAQERTHGGHDDDPGPTQLGPSVIRSTLGNLRQPMTVIGRIGLLGDGTEHRVLRVGPPDGDYIVKARAMPGKRLPSRMIDPNLQEILDYLFGDGPRPKAAKKDVFD